MTSKEWKSKGSFITIFNRKIFVIDTANVISSAVEKPKETLVVLHGYPTSSYDYHKVLDKLSEKYRVIIHDHLGFGFSDKTLEYSYSLIEQTDVALELWKTLKLEKVTILAHDYGTSICTEILVRYNRKQIDLQVEKLILCNGSPHIEFSKLRTIQKLLKSKVTGKFVASLTNYAIFRKNMRNTYFDKTKATNNELKEMWYQLEYNKGRKVIHLLSNYINERYYFWYRWIGALKETEIPTKIIWAKNDPIAIPLIAETLHLEIDNSELTWLENTGHFLMIENPNEFLNNIIE